MSPPQTHRPIGLPRHATCASQLASEAGLALIELLLAAAITIVIAVAAGGLLVVGSNSQARNQAEAGTIASTQAAVATLLHDLRGAKAVTQVGPATINFLLSVGGTDYNVQYNCNAQDTLGAPYTRCARTQAVAPAPAPAAGPTPGSLDIQHVYNNPTNGYNRFCNTQGTAPSGAVFFVSNPQQPNTDGSGLACDETYETTVVAPLPDYVQIRVQVPASGDTPRAGLTHFTVFQDGVFLPNIGGAQS